jgi:hypothetical protein
MIFANDKDQTLYYGNTSGVEGWADRLDQDARVGRDARCREVAGLVPRHSRLQRRWENRCLYEAGRAARSETRSGGWRSQWVRNRRQSCGRQRVVCGGRCLEQHEVPGKIIRMVPGANPPATCKTEVYEPPFDNPKLPGVEAYSTLGIGIDTNGVVWAALAGSNDLASFDRRKCKGPLNGPTATGQHCPEGWTLYPVPGPKFKGSDVLADSFYHNWVDRYDTLGLGKNVPIVNGTGSDSLIAFVPETKKFVTLRVPYPLDFYTRSVMAALTIRKPDGRGGDCGRPTKRELSGMSRGQGHHEFRRALPDPARPACQVTVILIAASRHGSLASSAIHSDIGGDRNCLPSNVFGTCSRAAIQTIHSSRGFDSLGR